METAKPLPNSFQYIVTVEQLKIEGPEPTPRALQAAVFYKKYIVVFGGRNYEEESYCLNDILMLDLNEYKWQPIVVYGFTPSRRWGHAIGVQKDSIIIFGGVTENSLASTSIYTLEFNKKYIKENLEECKKIKTILEVEAKKIKVLD